MPEPIIDFMLPGRWWRLPLSSPTELRRAARALAIETVGRADDLTRLRAELVSGLSTSAETARRAGASDFYVGRELAPGVPLPMSLAVYWPDVPDLPSRHAGSRAAAEGLATALAHADSGAVDVVEHADFGVVRSIRTAELLDDQGGAATRLDVSYWVTTSHSDRTLLLAFSTALLEHREAVVEVGDAIVGTLDWQAEGPA